MYCVALIVHIMVPNAQQYAALGRETKLSDRELLGPLDDRGASAHYRKAGRAACCNANTRHISRVAILRHALNSPSEQHAERHSCRKISRTVIQVILADFLGWCRPNVRRVVKIGVARNALQRARGATNAAHSPAPPLCAEASELAVSANNLETEKQRREKTRSKTRREKQVVNTARTSSRCIRSRQMMPPSSTTSPQTDIQPVYVRVF
jgi:hypothetical protein